MADLIPSAHPGPASCEPGNGSTPTAPSAIGEDARPAVADGGPLSPTLTRDEVALLRRDVVPVLRAADGRCEYLAMSLRAPTWLYASLSLRCGIGLSRNRNRPEGWVNLGDWPAVADFAAWLDGQVTP